MVNSTTEWLGLIALAITTVGLIWTKVVKPVRNAWRAVKAWMVRVEASVLWTEAQMKPNGGASLVDRVDQASAERQALRDDVAEIRKLLESKEDA